MTRHATAKIKSFPVSTPTNSRKKKQNWKEMEKKRRNQVDESDQSQTWCSRRHVTRSPRNKSRVRHGATEDT